MKTYKNILPSEIKENLFSEINDEWMLITAKKKDGSINAMTASWGGIGIMWGLPVCFCVIRPQRYTREFVDDSEKLTLTFLKEGYREALKICGAKSGRVCDKIKEAGLTPIVEDDFVGFEEAKMIIGGRKIYVGKIEESGFIDRTIIDSKYPMKDYHYVYVCSIEKVYVEDQY